MRFRLAATLLVLIPACGSASAPYRAEVLPTPFPGTVLTARGVGGECSSDGCEFAYTVRITNPTDRDADVQRCTLVQPPRMKLYVTGPMAGVAIRAHTVRNMSGRFLLRVATDFANELNELVGQRVSCTGLDWHGNRPI